MKFFPSKFIPDDEAAINTKSALTHTLTVNTDSRKYLNPSQENDTKNQLTIQVVPYSPEFSKSIGASRQDDALRILTFRSAGTTCKALVMNSAL